MTEYSKFFEELHQTRQSFIRGCPPGSMVEVDAIEDGEKITGFTRPDTHIYVSPFSTHVMVERTKGVSEDSGVFDISSVTVLELPLTEKLPPQR